MIPYGRHEVTDADVAAVTKVLGSDFLTQGPEVPRFESAVARHVGADGAVAVNSGTSALHVACMALGLEEGDVLWTVPNTFVASANCARYCGADVDFVDIDPVTWNMSVQALESKLEVADREGRLPKVVVPVHFAGQPTEQGPIRELADRYGFRVLEDASHAIGASRKGEPVGSCRWSDVTVFSFHPVKIITAGEGGLALTNDPVLGECMATLRTHGITRDPKRLTRSPAPAHPMAGDDPPPWYYEQQALGFNYRMTDIQAALGISQLARLNSYVAARNTLADRYHELLAGLPLRLPAVLPENRSAYHLYVVRLEGLAPGEYRRVFGQLREQGIGVNLHYLPVHLQPYYRALGFREGYCPEAEEHGRTAITLPLFPTLTRSTQEFVAQTLEDILS